MGFQLGSALNGAVLGFNLLKVSTDVWCTYLKLRERERQVAQRQRAFSHESKLL